MLDAAMAPMTNDADRGEATTPAAAAIVMLLSCAALLAGVAQRDDAMTVMSFNIRYGTADDGEHRWDRRRALLFDLLRAEDADLIGLQEALAFQIDEILAAVPGYGVVGVGRDDGRRAGELSPILFRLDRFQVAAAGTFWLSDTPEVIASRSWGNTIPRICTWARLVDRAGRAVWHFNVHFDHQSQPSRERSTQLLLARIDARPEVDEPVIVTGDFNAGEDNPAVTLLTRAAAGPPRFADTFRVRHPDEAEVGTFTGFDPARTAGEKIDYVFAPPTADVLDARIVRTVRDGRLPSDHFPVVARIRVR